LIFTLDLLPFSLHSFSFDMVLFLKGKK